MKPLLAHIYEPHRITFPCYVQPKLNGVRALYQDGCFQSRDELPWNPGILEHISRELLAIFPPDVITDGELYVHGWSLQRINGAITPVRTGHSVFTTQVEYHIFDRVEFKRSFSERWNSLPHGLALDRVRFVETKLVSSLNEGNQFYKEKVDEGYEGVMYRFAGCPYTVPKQERGSIPWFSLDHTKTKYLSDKDNRTWHLLKRKSWQDDEYLCTAFELTTGEKGEVGFQLTCVTPKGLSFNLGSGLSDSERDHYALHSPTGRKVKVKYLCLSDKGIPLNPTILAIL